MKQLLLVAALLFSLCCQAQHQRPMRLWYDRPAQYFEESLPIGNGKLGALVYGGTYSCLVYLNDITLWTGKPVNHEEGAGAAQWIPKIREALFKEDYARADSLQLHVEGHNSAYYQPLGTLLIEDLNKGTVNGYKRQLSLDSAVVRDGFCRDGKPITRTYFASAPDSLIAIRLTGRVNIRLSLTAQVPHKVKAKGNQLTQTGHAMGDPMESIHFCTILQANNKGGTVTANDSSLTIRDAEEVTIYIVNRTSFNGFDHHPVREGAPYLEKAIDDIWHTKNYSYEAFLQRHISDYQQYFQRVQLRLGPSSQNDDAQDIPTDRLLTEGTDNNYLETLYFQYGRYLLISSSRTKGVPANLQEIDGNFGGTAGVCEMLMQSTYANGQTAIIELLPACPKAWSEGKVNGLCARGGYEVSFEWKGGYVRDCHIKARKAGTITLVYNNQSKTFKIKAGQTLPVKTW